MGGFQLMLREPNFRIHMGAAALVLILSFWLGLTSTEWMVVVACIATVLAAEMFNTALEQLCNITEANVHPIIKKIKDTSAAAVLVVALAAAICGTIVLLPKIMVTIQIYLP
jgi:diacylglycerol kinase